jgi:hypothetical protein
MPIFSLFSLPVFDPTGRKLRYGTNIDTLWRWKFYLKKGAHPSGLMVILLDWGWILCVDAFVENYSEIKI